jgi:hypothetical protein
MEPTLWKGSPNDPGTIILDLQARLSSLVSVYPISADFLDCLPGAP